MITPLNFFHSKIEPDLYPIFCRRDDRVPISEWVKLVDANSSFSHEAVKSFKLFENIGFFTEPENKIVYNTYKNFIKVNNSFRYALCFPVPDSFSQASEVEVDTRTKHMFASTLSMLDNIALDKLSSHIKMRFRKYGFVPENGWKFIYYLDFITNCQHEWTEQEIRMLDKLKTDGLSMHTASMMVGKNLDYETMKDAIDFPLSWIKKFVEGAKA